MADRWHYVKHGRCFGPFSFEQLRQLTASGLLSPTDMVQDEATRSWMSAGTVPGLASSAPAPTAVPTVAPSTAPEVDPVPAAPRHPGATAGGPNLVAGRLPRAWIWTALTWAGGLGLLLMMKIGLTTLLGGWMVVATRWDHGRPSAPAGPGAGVGTHGDERHSLNPNDSEAVPVSDGVGTRDERRYSLHPKDYQRAPALDDVGELDEERGYSVRPRL